MRPQIQQQQQFALPGAVFRSPHPVQSGIYLATPQTNMFGSATAGFMVRPPPPPQPPQSIFGSPASGLMVPQPQSSVFGFVPRSHQPSAFASAPPPIPHLPPIADLRTASPSYSPQSPSFSAVKTNATSLPSRDLPDRRSDIPMMAKSIRQATMYNNNNACLHRSRLKSSSIKSKTSWDQEKEQVCFDHITLLKKINFYSHRFQFNVAHFLK